MVIELSRVVFLSVVLAAWSASLVTGSACSCDDEGLTQVTPGSCEPDFVCNEGLEYRLGACRASRCQEDIECCPGQKCNSAAGFCADQFVECTRDADCGEVPGQACIDFRGGQFCGYPNVGNALSGNGTQACVTTADCAEPRSCFGHRCVVQTPCEGGCRDGEVCDIDSNSCFAMPECTAQCGPGQIRVVSDPDTMSGPQCCKIDCKCETLPPVPLGQFGFYASLALSAEEVFVSAYDKRYGDLIVARFDLQGRKRGVDYVDGIPSSGAVVANPHGPRSGRSDPGPDVGEHTSIAIDRANVLHVAYYDRENLRLKYANYSGGVWTTSVVDESGDVGRYTSIAIGPDGNPRIAYMMAEGNIDPDPTNLTGLKYAEARTNLPTTASDWTTRFIDTRIKPPLICDGGCRNTEACVDLGGGPACRPTIAGCSPCGANEACVDRGGTLTCQARIPSTPLDDLIEGTGLFNSLAFTSTGTPIIAYYDRVDRNLRLAHGNGRGGFALETLDGDDPTEPTDVGQHASLAIGPGDRIGVAYFDATADDLVYLDVNTSLRQIVDNGVTPPDLRLVGADASLIYDEMGQPTIAYQDPTNLDLLYARRTGSPALWSTEVLRGRPPTGTVLGKASGFYASQKRLGPTAYVSNVDITFDAESNLVLELSVLLKSLF